MELLEGAVIANRFRLVRQLGKGGMGSVWLAQHIALDIPCAVKFIHADSAANPDARARFEREAKAAAQLRTPNVVQILDYGVEQDTPYIAMELLVGEPLSVRLERRVRLEPIETLRIVEQVGRALTKAHAAGIVHRDLKPENIFLVADEEGEVAKVLDFGVAKKTLGLSDSNTKTGALLGTPYYMSPEQAQGTKAVDSRADLWSLAVVVYRSITGDLPFRSEALGDLLIKIVMHPLPVPSQVAHGIPPGFDGWWQRAAQRDPDHRFQTAKALVEGLRQVLAAPGAGHTAAMPAAHAPVAVGSAPQAAATGPAGAGAWSNTAPPGAGGAQLAGTTPWPGGSSLPYAPGTGPSGAPALGAQPGAGPFGASAAGAHPYYGSAAAGTPAAGGRPFGGAAGDSGSGPSMAGFATQAGRPRSSGKRALIGALIAAGLVLGAIATVVIYLSMAPSDGPADATGEPGETSEPPSSASPESTADSQSPDADAGAEPEPAAGEPPDAGTTEADAAATTDTVARPATRPTATGPKVGPKTSPAPTTLDVPTAPAATKTKTGDLGF